MLNTHPREGWRKGELGQTQVVMAVALAVFCTGFLLGALWHRWIGGQRKRQEAAAELKRKAGA